MNEALVSHLLHAAILCSNLTYSKMLQRCATLIIRTAKELTSDRLDNFGDLD